MHRVVVPLDNYARARGRHCVAFFCHPDNDAQLPSLPLTCTPSPAPPTLTPHTHVTLHNRIMNAAHHLQKRFRETYAWLSRSGAKHASYELPVASWSTAPKFQSLKLIEDWIISQWHRTLTKFRPLQWYVKCSRLLVPYWLSQWKYSSYLLSVLTPKFQNITSNWKHLRLWK